MVVPQIDAEGITARFDETQSILFVAYRGILIPNLTIQFYEWRAEVVQLIDIKTIRGTVVDFRAVTVFPVRNLTTVYKQSRDANQQIDMSHIPVAMVVSTPEQEQSVRASLQVTPQQNRRRIVNTPEDALAFIEAWHRSRQETSAHNDSLNS
jgi:hypothetical protein